MGQNKYLHLRNKWWSVDIVKIICTIEHSPSMPSVYCVSEWVKNYKLHNLYVNRFLLSLLLTMNSAVCMYVKYSARRQVRPSTCSTRVVHISVYWTIERNEVVCQVLSSLSQWPYGNTFHCIHRHKSAANTTTKHPIRQIAPKLSQP